MRKSFDGASCLFRMYACRKELMSLRERISVSGGVEVECVDGANLQDQAPRHKEPDGLSQGNRRREAPVDYSRILPW